MKYRDKLHFSMAGHALRGNFMSVDYKEEEHSNHVLRSFITSSVRLSYKKERLSLSGDPFLFLFDQHVYHLTGDFLLKFIRMWASLCIFEQY